MSMGSEASMEQILAESRAYWKWGREPRAQYLLARLVSEVERLQGLSDAENGCTENYHAPHPCTFSRHPES